MMTPSQAFFHRRATHQWINDLSVPTDTAIYAGAGTTQDRTGLDWSGLLDAMLARYVPDFATRMAIRDHYSLEQQATILDGYRSSKVAADAPDGAKARRKLLRQEIREVLYGPHKHMGGKLAQSIVELAFQIASAGKSVVLVTPNYDQYLHVDLQIAADAMRSEYEQRGLDHTQVPKISFYAVDDQNNTVPPMEPYSINVIYIHGYVAEKDPKEDKGTPVLSEGDYGDSSGRTRSVLRDIFADRTVYIVGSSLADAPLVNALADTKVKAQRKKIRRVALLPSTTIIGESRPMSDEPVRAWQDRRLSYIGVEPIYPDFHIQTAQFLHEIQQCMLLEIGDQMTEHYSPKRYGFRLSTWWRAWYKANVETGSNQALHHEDLDRELKAIRQATGIPLDENLKLEFWLRWRPESSRTLALWASSVGSWVDPYTMRRDEIAIGSEYQAVQLFCGGSPRFLKESATSDSRWRTYFGTPIWYESGGTRIPVGVISLASMAEDGALSQRNLGRVWSALPIMQKLGERLVSIDDLATKAEGSSQTS